MEFFIDMDGVIAKWRPEASFEDVCARNYFLHLEPENSIIEAVKELCGNWKYPPVKILSAALSVRAAWEKQRWLQEHGLGQIEHIFVPCDEDKADYVEHPESSILIDDFGQNLKAWPGIKVKFYNGINGHGGTVYPYSIRSDWETRKIVNYIRNLYWEQKYIEDSTRQQLHTDNQR
jgi:hypothetical protein